MDKDFAAPIEFTYKNELVNPKAIRNRIETLKLVNKYTRLSGDVLDIGERNYFTEWLEAQYSLYGKIDSTEGDLDECFVSPKSQYDFVHYNNVIEHQFNPLYTLLCIKKVLKPKGILILGTPVKPNWITFSKCHFHEFDNYRINKLFTRAGFEIIDEVHFWRDIRMDGIRGILGSFYYKQAVYLLKQIS